MDLSCCNVDQDYKYVETIITNLGEVESLWWVGISCSQLVLLITQLGQSADNTPLIEADIWTES